MSAPELSQALQVDVEADHTAFLAEGNGDRKAHVAQANDRDFAIRHDSILSIRKMG
ncbi:hypothetical protein NH8B_3695 [Pseudogulbenkiania sp. NH8B]|nr:hypothetical protein NH8B_3695 [Pseudogulbenkiania sp. NH8B]